MKANSYEKSLLVGAIIGVIQIVLLTVFMAMVLHLTDGYGFFYKEGVNEQVRNIYLDDVDKIGYIVATIIPLILLRYDSIKYLLPIIISSIFSYFITFYALDAILYYIFSCNVLGRLDVLHFGGWIFPIGALNGTVLSVIIITIANLYKRKFKGRRR